jgi:hypothetical protein
MVVAADALLTLDDIPARMLRCRFSTASLCAAGLSTPVLC